MHHEDPNSALLSFCNRKHPPQMFEIDISKNVIFLLPPFKSNLLDNFSFQIYLQGTCLKSRMENTQTPRAMSKSNIKQLTNSSHYKLRFRGFSLVTTEFRLLIHKILIQTEHNTCIIHLRNISTSPVDKAHKKS